VFLGCLLGCSFDPIVSTHRSHQATHGIRQQTAANTSKHSANAEHHP
jgi:hypothetical protein